MDPILIISRPAPKGTAFVAQLTAMLDRQPGVIMAPAFDIVPTGAPVPKDGGVIFTSANAVAFAPLGMGRKAWCVGQATSHAARARGYRTLVAEGDAAALIALILSQRPTGPLWHLAGAHRRGDVGETLRDAGLTCETVVLYSQIALPPPIPLIDAAAGNAPLIAPVFSPRSASILALPDRLAPLFVVAMSNAVADAVSVHRPDGVVVAAAPDTPHMLGATRALWSEIAGTGNA
ncbi:uroporphyrinogen-III synthase [Loktanella sp. TSTF-M6]|uniref:Uroporphyrinogen-III synthase n=1 Tax=Loktanella gaetbuli TaxID=2881335 RepID=A0ABS8BTW1_9RHOB|nr:uroporphyrinogen-III synthase [Loktanella gaetbuli]MCB5199174.1 uroporphyrinogen-III synthase [Loktanella gaetbuli]